MKNYNQSKKTKERFLKESVVYHYMKSKVNGFTKEEMTIELGLGGERQTREKIAEVANYAPVIALSSTKGYKVLFIDDEFSDEELKAVYDNCQHQINDFQSRIDNLKARMKPLIALQKVIEKKLNKANTNDGNN